jgi:hypothetical protein
MTHSIDADLIHSYSRAQALEDGALVDVSPQAREVGIRFPLALTAAVWALLEPTPQDAAAGQSTRGRLHDLLWMTRLAIKRAASGDDQVAVEMIVAREGRNTILRTRAVVGPGDQAEPVITVMLPDES